MGQTVDEFRQKWNNYKPNNRIYVRNIAFFQKHFFQHFNSHVWNGFLDDTLSKEISVMSKTNSPNTGNQRDY